VQPLVSIIIPTYNRALLLGETLDSVIAQTYQNWECIVVDDGSTDDTGELMGFYCERDSRFQYFERSSTHKSGGCGARNNGLEISNADWIVFLDSEDLLIPSCLENRIVKLKFSQNQDMLVFPTGLFYNQVGDSNKLWNNLLGKGEDYVSIICSFLRQDMPWHTNSVLWRKSFLKKIGGWNENTKVWQDWELHIRAISYKPRLYLNNIGPDNFYRLQVKNSIASKDKTVNYIEETVKTIIVVESIIYKMNDGKLQESMKSVMVRNLINKPLSQKYNFLPIKFIFSISKTRTFKIFEYLKLYAILFVMKSTKIKKMLFNRYNFDVFQELKLSTSHLKDENLKLNGEEIIVLK
jgi:glycosyltransferase involved in cell wall biosynthesis